MSNSREHQVVPLLLDGALWTGAIVAGVLTLVYSLGAIPPGMRAFPDADKVGHALVCFATGLLLLCSAVWRPGRLGRFPGAAPIIVVGLIAAGIVIEALQATFTQRSAETLDVVMETVGAVAALGVFSVLRRRG